MNIIALLSFAILAVSQLPNGQPIKSFRTHPRGAEGHALELAAGFDEAARDNDVDVWTLAALAQTESAFDGKRIGRVGESSIMQLHPRYAPAIFYKSARRRGYTQDDLDRLAMNLGADVLRQGFETCGSWRQAVSWYKSGNCLNGPASRKVFAMRRRLMHAAGI